jgi:hypothetical protein
MASLVIIATILTLAGLVAGAFITLCLAIRREDRIKGALRLDAPDKAAQSACTLVGISSRGWN